MTRRKVLQNRRKVPIGVLQLLALAVWAANVTCGGTSEPPRPAPSAAASTISVSSATVPSGSAATVTLQVKDAGGANLPAGGLTVVFGLGAGTSQGTFGAVADNGNGTYTATFTGTIAGTPRTITATMDGQTVAGSAPAVTVVPGPVSLSQSAVEASAASLQVGASATLTLRARDAAGNSLTTGGLTVTFTKGAGTSDGTMSAVTDAGNGTYTASFTATVAGSARAIGATIGGNAVTSTGPSIVVTDPPANPASAATSVVTVSANTVVAGSQVTITLQAKDAGGADLTAGGATVTFSLSMSGTSSGTIGVVTDNGDGTYTASFSATTAGTARTIQAAINGATVTTAMPAVTVVAGPVSPARSIVTVSNEKVPVSGTSTFTLTTRDALDNQVTTGGRTVTFALSGGTSAGTIGPVADNLDGTYTAQFTGTTEGTIAAVAATVDGSAVTAAPALIVYTPGITFSSDRVQLMATQGEDAAPSIVGIFANGGTTAEGLQASVTYTSDAIPNCQNTNWLGTPTFDFTTASPVSLVTLNASAANLGIVTCTARVTVTSSSPGIASKSFDVSLGVARNPIISTAVQLVFMGNAGDPSEQQLVPDARILISNGGRGTLSGLHASVIDVQGNPAAWLTDEDLRWEPVVADTNARTAPSTLVVRASVEPFTASATIRVTGSGIAPIDIPLQVFFNIEPELVTNPRGMVFNIFDNPFGAVAIDSVIAFNQNREIPDSLRNYRRNAGAALPEWLNVTITPLTNSAGQDTAAKVVLSVDPESLVGGRIYTDTVRLEADACTTNFGTETTCTIADPAAVKTFAMPVTVIVEPGMVLSSEAITLFAPAGSGSVSADVLITNGGSTPITGLITTWPLSDSWLTATITGGDAVPTTVRVTADLTGLPPGTVLQSNVNVFPTPTPSPAPGRSIPVTLRVY